MAIDITVDSQLSVVKGAPATNDQPGFAALTYTDVGKVENFPDFGGNREVATFTPVDTGIVAKFGGSKDYGTVTIPIGLDNSDAGQGVLEAGFDGSGDGAVHSVKITNDAAGTIYFQAMITGFQYSLGDANAVTRLMVTFAVTNKVIKVAA